MVALRVALFLVCTPSLVHGDALGSIRQRGTLRWGADAEGGAPYVFHEPSAPDKLTGFEADLANALAARLKVRAEMVQENWDMLVPALRQQSFDIILNGLERTPENAVRVELSRPYLVYNQQLVVLASRTNVQGLKDLAGASIGVLSGSVSLRVLQAHPEITTRIYQGNAETFRDLKVGRLAAVLVDSPVAIHFARPDAELRLAGEGFAPGYYAIGVPLGETGLRQAIDQGLEELLADGTLEKIHRRYHLWDPGQEALRTFHEEAVTKAVPLTGWNKIGRYLPLLLRASLTTIGLTLAGMTVAVAVGLAVVMARLHGPSPLRWLAIAYTEIMRGTPLLIQLYFIYYGLAQQLGLRLSEYVAAILALGLNYAASEAENYRAGFGAIPRGQWEAAAALGMGRWLTIRRIILPQAFRLVLPPMSNDLIAMFKDSSIVSVIAIVELTKEYQIRANDTGDYLGLGLMTAALYFGMSYAASLAMQRLERKLNHDRR
jgi:polar amino acid transport system substrate-binding protein